MVPAACARAEVAYVLPFAPQTVALVEFPDEPSPFGDVHPAKKRSRINPKTIRQRLAGASIVSIFDTLNW
jgi:hypothetical protein